MAIRRSKPKEQLDTNNHLTVGLDGHRPPSIELDLTALPQVTIQASREVENSESVIVEEVMFNREVTMELIAEKEAMEQRIAKLERKKSRSLARRLKLRK